ncbi:MAG TPA: carboxypeptidase-like regulatory domain-containing protein [Pyrinomonadaceae bacterium]|nr:carboxypeptidase-like regulatory domain-containing protein [Pyrinomonadaceae bacterium]
MAGKRNRFYFVAVSLGVLAILWAAMFSSVTGFVDITARANNYYIEISSGSPYLQNWSDTNQISADDNWTGVVAIEAFRGDGLAPVPGTDPRTILADSPNNPLDVNANQTNPATTPVDGVAEFEIADPVVALKGSDTATAPNLVIHLNTSMGCSGKPIIVSFRLRDIDSSANNAVTPVATQYRIGGSGNYTSVANGYLADATTGPNQATFQRFMSVRLPNDAINQTMLDVRIITTNAVGADEWVGIDDINVNCFHPTVGQTTVYGRAVDQNGRGISNAQVTLLNADTQETMTALTNGFGIFRFNNLQAGYVFVATIQHRRYTFKPNTQAFELLGDKDDLDFTGFAPN